MVRKGMNLDIWILYLRMYGALYEFRGSSWWRHQLEAFCALLALCTGNSMVTGDFHSQSPVTRSFDFLSTPEQTVEYTIETPVIWDAIAVIMTSL